jgi:hypothetical protein
MILYSQMGCHRMFLCVLLACAVGVASAASPGKGRVRKEIASSQITVLSILKRACQALITKLIE